MLAQGATGFLVQRFDIIANIRTIQQAKAFDHLKGKATRHTSERFVTLHIQHRLKQGCNLAINEMLQPARDFLNRLRPCFFIYEG